MQDLVGWGKTLDFPLKPEKPQIGFLTVINGETMLCRVIWKGAKVTAERTARKSLQLSRWERIRWWIATRVKTEWVPWTFEEQVWLDLLMDGVGKETGRKQRRCPVSGLNNWRDEDSSYAETKSCGWRQIWKGEWKNPFQTREAGDVCATSSHRYKASRWICESGTQEQGLGSRLKFGDLTASRWSFKP